MNTNSIDPQLKVQQKEVVYCTKCVVSNQRPRIQFNSEGVCNACLFAERKYGNEIDWKARELELEQLLDKHRSKDGSYDVVVPGSGGKDSIYVARELKVKWGMHPLTVTLSPFLYTDVGYRNFQNFIKSGFDNLFFNPNGQLHRKLSYLGFELMGDPWQPFGYGVYNYPFHVAVKHGIKLVFFGENGEAEYGGNAKNDDVPGHALEDFADFFYKGTPLDTLLTEGLRRKMITEDEAKSASHFYRLPPYEEVRKAGSSLYFYSYFNKWIPQENYYYAKEHTAFEANPDGRSEGTYSKYASLDDKTDGFHYWMMFIKFGLGRATQDAAHEIRDGHITREEGVSLVKRYDGEFPKLYFKEFIDYIGINEEKFWNIVDKYRAPHLWKKENGEWKLRHAVWMDESERKRINAEHSPNRPA